MSNDEVASGVTFERCHGIEIEQYDGLAPARTRGVARDIDDFLDIVAQCLAEYQDRLGVAPEERLSVSQKFPADRPDASGTTATEQANRGHVAVFRLIWRRRGATSRNPLSSAARRPVDMLLLDRVPVVDENEQIVPHQLREIYGRLRDNFIAFDIHAPTPEQADRSALLFETMMETYKNLIRSAGFNDLRFEERSEDTTRPWSGTTLYVRPLRFWVRTQVVSSIPVSTIRNIDICADTGPDSVEDRSAFPPTIRYRIPRPDPVTS